MASPENPSVPVGPASPAHATVGRRDWLKVAMAAGAAVAGVAAAARAEAQEAAPPQAQPGLPSKAEAASGSVAVEAVKAEQLSIIGHFGSIQGDAESGGGNGPILIQHVSFSSSASKSGKNAGGSAKGGKLSVEQSPVSVEMRAGKWVAEFQQACYDQTPIGDVVLAQFGAAGEKGAEVQQKVTLTNAVVTSVQQAWDTDDGPRTASISFSFDKILLQIGTKPADFTLRNITDKAV